MADHLQGLDTRGIVELRSLGLAHEERVHYAPSSWLTLPRIARVVSFSKDDVFVDFGSGKGRVVALAARYYPFKRVIGVEISPDLNAIARCNIQRNHRRLKCKKVDVVTADVTAYEIPTDITIAYFYAPFTGTIFKSVVNKIQEVLKLRPDRNAWIVLQRPLESPRVDVYNECNAFLSTRSWLRHRDVLFSRTHSITIYESNSSELGS
jgi:SAM-dependent methyltransferase